MDAMNIGEAAKASGVSAKMIRHYEAVGLVPAPTRTESGYRQYNDTEVHTLRFIRQARDLGFSIHEIGELLSLWHNRKRPSRLVKALAEVHIEALEQKAQELLAMKSTLEHLVHCCHGDDRPECPILDVLASNEPVAAGRSRALDRRTTKERSHSCDRHRCGTDCDVRRKPLWTVRGGTRPASRCVRLNACFAWFGRS